jgi:hypothetical protein
MKHRGKLAGITGAALLVAGVALVPAASAVTFPVYNIVLADGSCLDNDFLDLSFPGPDPGCDRGNTSLWILNDNRMADVSRTTA